MTEQETKSYISVAILKRVEDQSPAQALREILFNPNNKINWEKAEKSLIKNIPELKALEELTD